MLRWLKITAVLVLLLSTFTLYTVNRLTANVDSVALSSCRSSFRQPLDSALAELQVEVGKGLRAAADGDQVALDAAAAALDPIFTKVETANEDWAEANDLSLSDPAALLERCKEGK